MLPLIRDVRQAGRASKRDFANRAARFANRALRWPGIPVLPAVALAVALVAASAGAFGTGAQPPGQRLVFWLALMGIETAKWLAWLGWQVRAPRDYWRAALIGTPLLGVFLPLEIAFVYRVLEIGATVTPGPILLQASIVALAILLVMLAIRPPWYRDRKSVV